MVDKDQKVFLISKYQYSDGSYRSLHKGYLININQSNLDRLNEHISNILDSKSNDYDISRSSVPITNLVCDFFILPKGKDSQLLTLETATDYLSKFSKTKLDKFTVKESSFFLPLDMNYLNWGKVSLDKDSMLIIKVDFNKQLGYVFVDKITKEVEYNCNTNIIKFSDQVYNNEIFIRKFEDGTKFYIRDNQIILKIKPLKTEFIEKIAVSKSINKKIGTLDIETVVKNNVQIPYLYAFYDGLNNSVISFFSNSPEGLFNHILHWKFKGYTIYAHNLSSFDVVFLFKYITNLEKQGYKVKILKKDEKIISIKISNRSKNVSITLKDSLLLLPQSLDELAKQFKLSSGKTTEPVYVGEGHDEYKSTDLSHYTKAVNKITVFSYWKELIESYCINDCIVLYQVLVKYQSLIFSSFNIDIIKYPTVPSLAFAIYRMHYMPSDTIPITKGKVFNFIRRSYTGGSTEMYKPNAIGQNIYCYDVNSLYPSVMAKAKYPVGQIFYFEGDPSVLDVNTYWIGEAVVKTRKDLYQPYLQVHHKTDAGWRTIAPNGCFEMVIHSSEYHHSKKDYDISVSKGYLFEATADLFSDYVNDMFALRQQYSKSEPMNYVAKLLNNSLYGRFGMEPQLHSHIFTTFEGIQRLISNNNEILDFIDLGNNQYFVSYQGANVQELDNTLPRSKKGGVSISVASAVTAYARIYMSQFKNNIDYNLFYTDTDSIFIDRELDSNFVNSELGNMKLEYTFKDSIFLAPKVYCGITNNGAKIVKVKGFTESENLNLDDFIALLDKDAKLTLSHTKWFRPERV